MKKVLIVKYTPREDSNTQKLLAEAMQIIAARAGSFEIEELDLTVSAPDLMGRQSITSYLDDIGWETAGPDFPGHSKGYLHMKKLANMITNSDFLVLAFPFYNFFLPGIVKLWLDNVTLEGVAFERTDYGPKGLWTGKQALVINTSGGTPKDSSRDFSSPYLRYMFKYWGFEGSEIQGLYGINYSGILPERLKEFKTEIERVVASWL